MSRGELALEKIVGSLAELDTDGVKGGVEEALDASVSPYSVIKEGLGRGMEVVGTRYERGEYFLSELILASAIMNEVMEILQPHLKSGVSAMGGRVVIGTVEGDLHDIGKNLVISMLMSAGFEVHDLGVDVSPDRFVEKVRELNPDIVCMSALLSVTIPKVEETIKALEEASVRKGVKVLVGGRCLNKELATEMKADAYGEDAWDAVLEAKKLIEI